MARIQHIITLHNDEWTVVVDGKHSAPYATQKENKIGITVNTSTSIRAKPKRWL
ncbi:GH18 family chitinase [Bradyrhizobium sp. USDA 326]